MDRLMEYISELNEKGTYKQQAEMLFDEEKRYKKLIATYKKIIENETDDELRVEFEKMLYKYNVRLERTKEDMVYLNRTIIESLEKLEDYVEFSIFVGLYELLEDEIDETCSYYDNLIMSTTKVGHVCRTGLIHNEKMVKECR